MLPRIRTIKPEFFRHEGLFDLEKESGLPLRLAFAGLWTCCDREGRFLWRPRELKAVVFPHEDIDFSRILEALSANGFIVRYASSTRDARVEHASSTRDARVEHASQRGEFGYIPTWKKHQFINSRESASELPSPFGDTNNLHENQSFADVPTRGSRVGHASGTRAAQNGNGNGTVSTKTPLPPVERGEIIYLERYHEIVEVDMGRHKRLPNMETQVGARAAQVASFLTAKGFPARVVQPGVVEEGKEA